MLTCMGEAWDERQSARMSKITNDGLTCPLWHRMLFSCTRIATVGVKGLIVQQVENACANSALICC